MKRPLVIPPATYRALLELERRCVEHYRLYSSATADGSFMRHAFKKGYDRARKIKTGGAA